MKIKENSTIIRDGRKFKHFKSWAILDDDNHVIKKFDTMKEAKTFIIEFKEAVK